MDFLSPNYSSSISGTNVADQSSNTSFQKEFTPIKSAVDSVSYIADHLKNDEEDRQVSKETRF